MRDQTHGVEWIDADSTIEEAAEKMRRFNIAPLPVCRRGQLPVLSRNNRLVGMVTANDVRKRLGE